MDNSFRFLYWDDPGDSQEHVDKQKKKVIKPKENEEPNPKD